MSMRGIIACVVVLSGCATIAPPRPRFSAVYEQRTEWCRIQVVQDTRSGWCFVAFQCGRRPVVVLEVGEEVCVP